jgi:hypothetical protein
MEKFKRELIKKKEKEVSLEQEKDKLKQVKQVYSYVFHLMAAILD